MLRAAASIAGLTAAFVFVLYLAYSGDSVPGPSPSPSPAVVTTPSNGPSPSPAAGELPDFLKGVEVTKLEVGPEIEFPKDNAIIVEGGCYQCDPPPTRLMRVYRSPNGDFRVDPLFTLEKVGLSPGGADAHFVTGFAMSESSSEIIVSVCNSCGEYDFNNPSAQTMIFRSVDGGITWSGFGEIAGNVRVVGEIGEGSVLLV